jgi:hypothetical protein
MVERRWERFVPVAGLAFGVLFALGMVLSGDTPSVKATGAQVVAHYADRRGQVIASAFLLVLLAVLIVFFAGSLRAHLRARAGGDSLFGSVAFAGVTIYAVALLFEAALTIALLDVGKEALVDAARALNVLQNDDFFLFIGGIAITLLATAAEVFRGAGLPRWIGWAALVLGLASLAGPVGIAAFLLFPVWVIAVSVLLLSRREERRA